MRSAVIVVAVILNACQASPVADEHPQLARYSIKQDEASTGSRREIVIGGIVPFDKRYSELTVEQQRILKSHYERMGDADEPPFPVNGLRPIYLMLASGQQELRVHGPLTIFVEVDSQGRATKVSVLQSPSPEMTKFAASVLLLEKYKPAVCNGIPCTMEFPFRITFESSLQ
jgi:TonB-like protein